MIIDKDGNVTIITQEKKSIIELIKKIDNDYNKFQHDNLVINLSALDQVSFQDILEFLEISNRHRSKKLSFVIVCDKVNLTEMPNELLVVPTLHEANDIIEMEEIERDLGF
ncbi:hypothetical protein SAMN03097699_1219 [Flavobacteriaceae bacterium MAR_2010_188]|nr:hypothetical protein SAMN03097699_1219 [Flavobacteriaceae bacterium MAR_2010_188]